MSSNEQAPAPLAELTRLPDPQFIRVGEGLRIATYSWGELDDPVVVVVHGFASSTKDNWVATGWVRDLLREASRDETGPARRPAAPAKPKPAERSPLHVVESLNSLSVDIARAIDHETSIELWDRYRRGERDVFTRRLYTLKGQQTFDEIKRKYDREPEFRNAVDRYIADFEKLLADVARTDRDRTAMQSYLTSDTGKVYTMLAHAAGRLG